MISIRPIFFVSVLTFVGIKEAHVALAMRNSSSATPVGSPSGNKFFNQRGVDETMLDREWERDLNDLKRLKLDEMKKTIRSRVLSENIHPYYSVKDIFRRLRLLKLYDPENVEIGHVRSLTGRNSTYRTVSGQGIFYVKISETDEGDKYREGRGRKIGKPIVVIVAGIGGCDWIAVHAIMYVITKLITSYEDGKLLGFDWWIIPLLNPDGYITSKKSINYKLNINSTNGCWGVNLDRNFLFQRASCLGGNKRIKCEEYPGEHPFSEIESRALRDFILPRVDDCKVFVALKEGVKALVYPFASSLSSPPSPHAVLQKLLCIEALEEFDESHSGKKELFRFGNSGSVFGPSNGYVEDWAKKHMGIARSFAFHIADGKERRRRSFERFKEYGKGTFGVIKILATSRRIEPYAETFEELITNLTIANDSSKRGEYRSVPWARESIHKNLLSKIKRGAKLEMPLEFTRISEKSRYENLDRGRTK